MADFLNTYIFHWTPAKAVWIGGYSLSWDARCAGLYIGYAIGLIYHLAAQRKANILPPWPILVIVTLLFLPVPIDVYTVKYGLREPLNNVRYLTGLLFGASVSVYLYPAFITISYAEGNAKSAIDSLYKVAAFFVFIFGVFFIRWWNSIAAYAVLEFLSYFGFFSFFAVLIVSIFKMVVIKFHH